MTPTKDTAKYPLEPPEIDPPPTVAGHVYAVSKLMWLTVSDEEFDAFRVLAWYMPVPLVNTPETMPSSALLPVEMALSQLGENDGEPDIFSGIYDILRQAQREDCAFITVRTP